MSNIFFEHKKNKILKNILIDKSHMGIIVTDRFGVIQFANQAVEKILGSKDRIGLNGLDFESVKNSKLHAAILSALDGKSVELKQELFEIGLNRQTKVLNVKIEPIRDLNKGNVENVLMTIDDVSEEALLRMKLKKTYLTGLEALASLVDAKDSYTGEHSKNVSRYVSTICENFGCDLNADREKVKIAASFHDIGKIGIPDYILKKDDRLTQEEYEIMKTHPAIGSDVISKIDDFEEISRIIRHHHERWDGKGYPDGLKGNEIPFGSQIIAIADTYDAIISDRVYRKSRDKNTAMEILLEERGKQFNAELVDQFLKNV